MGLLRNILQNKNKKPNKNHIVYIFWVVFVCIIITGLSILLNKIGIGKENTLMIFLLGVLAITVLTKGYFYGFIASIVSVLIFNYFFTEPLYTFIISNGQDYILIVFFLVASLITGTLSSKFQSQTEIAKQNEKTAKLLYTISKSFLNLTGITSIVNHGMNYIYEHTGCPCSVTLDSKMFYECETLFKTIEFPSDKTNQTYTLPIKDLSYQMGTMTIAGVQLPLSYENDILIKTVVYQMALVLDREFINNERERIKLAMEKEHLKSTLLRSISHDIRTPLTGIMGASSFILDSYGELDTNSIKQLIYDIKEETARLVNSVQNILDMTRISEGHLVVKKEFEAVDDLIGQAIKNITWFTNTDRLQVIIPEDIIGIEVDGRLIVQLLVNLIDNAYKHSGANSKIELKAYKENEKVIFEVSDNGHGIDDMIKETLFDGFVTYPRDITDGKRGVGLGLSICKAIVEAHNGVITARNKVDRGAIFRIELPCGEE